MEDDKPRTPEREGDSSPKRTKLDAECRLSDFVNTREYFLAVVERKYDVPNVPYLHEIARALLDHFPQSFTSDARVSSAHSAAHFLINYPCVDGAAVETWLYAVTRSIREIPPQNAYEISRRILLTVQNTIQSPDREERVLMEHLNEYAYAQHEDRLLPYIAAMKDDHVYKNDHVFLTLDAILRLNAYIQHHLLFASFFDQTFVLALLVTRVLLVRATVPYELRSNKRSARYLEGYVGDVIPEKIDKQYTDSVFHVPFYDPDMDRHGYCLTALDKPFEPLLKPYRLILPDVDVKLTSTVGDAFTKKTVDYTPTKPSDVLPKPIETV